MKISCKVFIRRSKVLNSSARKQTSTLALSQDHQNMCLLTVFNNDSKNGIQYKLIDNLETIHDKFLKSGLATLVFKNPNHSVFLECGDKLKLKLFIQAIQVITTKKNLRASDRFLPMIAKPISKKTVVTKLLLTKRADIPLNGIPKTVEILRIEDIDFKIYSNSIRKLTNLTELVINNANITEIADQFRELTNLKICNLSRNNIVDFRWLSGHLKSTLMDLDLSHNKLTLFPSNILKLQKLQSLNLSDNLLQTLPRAIQLLHLVKYVNVSNNQITYFPITILNLPLNTFDISKNPLSHPNILNSCPETVSVKSLKELSAISVLENTISSKQRNLLPETVKNYLNSAMLCTCGRRVIDTFYSQVCPLDFMNFPKRTRIIYGIGMTNVPMMRFLCSKKCLKNMTFSS